MNEWTKERQKAARDLGPEYNMVFGADVGAMLAEIERCWGEIERLTAALEDLRPSEDEPPTPAERVTEDELAAAQKLISALVSVDDAARHLSEEAEISGSPTSPTVEVGYPCWLDLQTALDTIDRGEGHDAPPGAPALTMFDRLAAEVRALQAESERRGSRIGVLQGLVNKLEPANGRLATEIESLRATVESLRHRLDVRTAERDRLLAARPAPAAAPHGGDPCAACTAILGSPQPCAMTHDAGPGAYPAEVSLEVRGQDAFDVVRAVDASRPAPAERTFPRVTLGSVAPGSLIEIASGDVGLVLGGSYETAPRHVAYLKDGIARELGASVTVSLRATPAELDALTSADASRPTLTEEKARAEEDRIYNAILDRPGNSIRGEDVRWGIREALHASRGDIPADVRAGEAQRELACPCGHSNDAHDETGCRAYTRGDSVCRCDRPRV